MRVMVEGWHHRADEHGYVREHIVVAEKKYGRLLKNNEIVHHLNHEPHDNRPENLVIMNRHDHMILHKTFNRLQKVGA